MKRWPLLLALPALVAITATARAADDPDTVLRQIRTENSKRLQEQEPNIAAGNCVLDMRWGRRCRNSVTVGAGLLVASSHLPMIFLVGR